MQFQVLLDFHVFYFWRCKFFFFFRQRSTWRGSSWQRNVKGTRRMSRVGFSEGIY